MDKHLTNKSQEYQKQSAARTKIWHAKNKSNIYNKLFMLACPIPITIMLQQRCMVFC